MLLVEEGPLKTSSDFKMQEADAYPELYQEGIGRMSKDGAITILQGRAVGGTTLINWTSSFRTPEPTLQHWAQVYGVKGHSAEDMAPWFEKMEQRLHVAPWALPPNANNDVIRLGCEKLGYHWKVIPRNVLGCWNLGYCGMGCPVNAKQSMLVTTIPATLDKGGELLYLARANRLLLDGDKVTGLECLGMDERCVAPNGRRIRVRARHYVLSGGGINTPAILLRSKAPDPSQRVGKRTFLHTVISARAVRPGDRTPSTRTAVDLLRPFPMGRRCHDACPTNWRCRRCNRRWPRAARRFGSDNACAWNSYRIPTCSSPAPRGFHPDSARARSACAATTPHARLPDDRLHPGRYPPCLPYHGANPVRRRRPGMRRLHSDGVREEPAGGARIIDACACEIYRTRLGSAHVMGGCAMGEDPAVAVADSLGRHHHLRNLSIHDGSLFPTSIGANPQLSVYGLTAQLASALAERLARA